MPAISEASTGNPHSFRDPAGFVLRHQGRILRSVSPEFLPDFEEFLASSTARTAMDAGDMVHSQRVLHDEGGQWFEHEAIPFPSYPFEWPAAMLAEAASLTLRLAESALEDGFRIKDATPHNVLFRGCKPVFVDVLSFEKRDPLDQVWMAYAQFVRTFLLPLAAERYAGIPVHQTLAAYRDGLEPEQLYRSLGVLRRIMPPLLGLVTIPKWLAGWSGLQPATGASAPESKRRLKPPLQAKARSTFVMAGVLRSCGRQLRRLEPAERKDSVWSGYLDRKSLYSAAQLEQKETFARRALKLAAPRSVLDVGANEGHFSLLAARAGARVVAIDSDPAVVGALYRRAAADRADILPLVVDLTRPTPAVGWRNQECPSFLDRSREQFDLVLMLAVIHHLLVTERIPLEEVLSLAAELSRDYVLIEYVAPQDPMFQTIARGRERLYAHLTQDHFESAAKRKFEQAGREQITGMHRWLYLFRRR